MIGAEAVAERAVEAAREYLSAEAPVGPYLADQLLLPIAMAGKGAFHTLPLTAHTQTNIDVIKRFLSVRIQAEPLSARVWKITIGT